MAKHSRLSASRTSQWVNCPGSLAIEEAFGSSDGGSGQAAMLGTAAHGLVERCLGEGSLPEDYRGRLIEIVDPDGEGEGVSILRRGAKWPADPQRVVFEVDGDMIQATERMVFYVHRRCVELELMEVGEPARMAKDLAGLVEKGIVRLETRVNPLPDRDDTGGTADVTIDAWPVTLEIVDYKNGSGVFVPIEGNMQVRSYLLGNMHLSGVDDYETVRYTICQPRHREAPEDGVMFEEVEPDELFGWGRDVLAPGAARVDEARAAVHDGATQGDPQDVVMERLFEMDLVSVGENGSHCTFCSLRAGCPAAARKVQDLAAVEFEEVEPSKIEDTPMGPNRLAVLLPWMPFVDAWVKDVKGDAERLMLSGKRVDGYKLVRGKSTRHWVEQREDEEGEVAELTEEDIVRELEEDFGLSRDDLYTDPTPQLKSGPQVEKLLRSDQRKRFNERLLFKPEGKLTVAPESDSKPAVEVDPADEFKED